MRPKLDGGTYEGQVGRITATLQKPYKAKACREGY